MKKIGVIFGGMSTENEVSVKSAEAVIKNIDKEKYEICPIYIDKIGNWYKITQNKTQDSKKQKDVNQESETQENINQENKIQESKTLESKTQDNINQESKTPESKTQENINQENKTQEKIANIIEYLNTLDVVFPVLHGLYGEDGTIQGLLELIKKPYVGCKVLASSIGMDKVYTKIIFEKAGLNQAKYEYIRKYKENYIYVDSQFNEEILSINEISKKIVENLKFPMFVKPSNSGSSVGISKAKNQEELEKYIEFASKFDNKILIEEGIEGQEVECAVLGNEEVIASCVGEINPAEEFYSYDAKYNNEDSKTCIPANISKEIEEKIKRQSIKAFKAINGNGLSRVDFFVEKDTQKIYINEINTLPGFTSISMYPKLFEASGISYRELLTKILENP